MGQIVNTPKITHGHVVPIRPIRETGLFSSEAWKEAAGDAKAEDEFEVVVYNSLTVDPDSAYPSPQDPHFPRPSTGVLGESRQTRYVGSGRIS